MNLLGKKKYSLIFLLIALFAGAFLLIGPNQIEASRPGSIVYLPWLNTAQEGFCYDEVEGVIVGEVEHFATEDWDLRTSPDGYGGTGYYHWGGGNHFTSPGEYGWMQFKFNINTPGIYQMRIRNLHTHPDPTEENDYWTKVDTGEWYKTFSSEGGVWNWRTHREITHTNHDLHADYNLSAGMHTLEISARSEGMSIDRIVFYLSSVENDNPPTDIRDLARPISPPCPGYLPADGS